MNDRRFPLGLDANGLARILRVDADGRLEVTLAGGAGVFQRQAVYLLEGPLYVHSGSLRIPNAAAAALRLLGVRLDVGSAPLGQGLVVDVHKDGVSIFSDPAKRPAVAAGAVWGASGAPDAWAWAVGERLTVDVDQVGSEFPGSDLTVTILVVGG